MNDASEITFRDFAGAIMQNDVPAAAGTLQVLLKVDEGVATGAAEHFQAQMKSGPAFMMKAMGMRTVVTEGSQEALTSLLGECFGLEGDALTAAAGAVWQRYRSGSGA